MMVLNIVFIANRIKGCYCFEVFSKTITKIHEKIKFTFQGKVFVGYKEIRILKNNWL